MRVKLLVPTFLFMIALSANAYDYMGTFRSEAKFDYLADDGHTYKCQIKSITFDEANINGRHVLRISPAELLCDGVNAYRGSFSHTLPGHTFLVDAAFPGCLSKLGKADTNPLNSCLEFYPFDLEQNRRKGTGRGRANNVGFRYFTTIGKSLMVKQMTLMELKIRQNAYHYSNLIYDEEVEGLTPVHILKKGLVEVPLVRLSY